MPTGRPAQDLKLLEDHADPPSTVQIHLQPLLRETRNLKIIVRLPADREVRRRQFNREVEEGRLREVVLPVLRGQKGHQLQDHLYLQGAQGRPRGGEANHVQKLRMQRVRQQ